ncbi:aminotransferase class I/II-fold pyridoxal phosphate-dependent enzyme [Amycolatopsis sp. cg5]|uniref:aminotransferase class I/II-fold pyridoxal phosphate-dependent enzyme n=1 Tax=Amycolatopsis sp. cg5 TaxID=3238802 RepID=UPI003523C256
MVGRKSLDLTMNTVQYPPSPDMLAAMLAATESAHEYPDMRATELIGTLAARLGVPSDRVLVGPGSAALCQLLVMTVAGPGDEVVYPWPSFEGYPEMVVHAGATRVAVPLRGHGIDLKELAAAVTERTKAVLLCNPNNPTGTVFSDAELAEFVAAVPDDVLVIVDEAYREFVTEPGFRDALAGGPRGLCVLRTFSKAYGLAGLRVGYLVASPALVARLKPMMPLFAVGSHAQAAALAALNDEFAREVEKRCAAVAAERDRLVALLRAQGWSLPDGHGNFVWLPVGERSAELTAFFRERDVLVRLYPGDGVRITVTGRETGDLVAGIAADYLLENGVA